MKSEGFTFPVGRVEYCYLHPATFDEFLAAQGETEALKYIFSVKPDTVIPEEIHTMMMKKFHSFLLVGGMPEAVARYVKKFPQLLYLDIGLVNYQIGMRTEIAMMDDINAVFHGQVGEQIAGQTLLALNTRKNANLHYWYREQKGATSEVDYLIVINDRLVPVEVKSCKTGTLRSLHNFMDESRCDFAIRIYSGNMRTEQIATFNKKKFTLFSVPFYLLFRIHDLL
jgi:predicted AAA+ superfamily ATPase